MIARSTQAPAILAQLAALSDVTRCRLLQVLSSQELIVAELCQVLQLPQSTVSRHLRVLADRGWVRSRPEGTRSVYSLASGDLGPAAADLWHIARKQVSDTSAAREDARRLERLLAARRRRSRAFFASKAAEWDAVRDELFGSNIRALSLLGLLEDQWTVGDLGCGTGAVTEALAPFVEKVVAIDGSREMLRAARARLRGRANVELRQGRLERLPLEGQSLDAATLILVLHHLPDPARVLVEVARTLRPGGRLLIVDMLPHERQEYRQQMGHVWLGFAEDQLGRFLAQAGLSAVRFRNLPLDPAARGPALFTAAARRTDAARPRPDTKRP